MEAAMRHIDGSDAKPCDEDEGGCGAMNGISHDIAGAALPEMFCVALTWDTASPERATVTETLGNVSTALDLAKVFEKMPAGGTEYRLRCVMCYYGEHYAAFAVSDAGAGGRERWLLFDDATTKEVGGWEDVVASCAPGRLLRACCFIAEPPNEDAETFRGWGRARAPGRGRARAPGRGLARRRGEDVFRTRGRASRRLVRCYNSVTDARAPVPLAAVCIFKRRGAVHRRARAAREGRSAGDRASVSVDE